MSPVKMCPVQQAIHPGIMTSAFFQVRAERSASKYQQTDSTLPPLPEDRLSLESGDPRQKMPWWYEADLMRTLRVDDYPNKPSIPSLPTTMTITVQGRNAILTAERLGREQIELETETQTVALTKTKPQ